MSGVEIIALVLAIALLAYLLTAFFKPEWFA